MSSGLSIELLGTFEVALDGRSLRADLWVKTQALVAYLVLEADRPHRREALAGLLWPDSPNEAALASLRQALRQLRKVVPELSSCFEITPQAVHFRVGREGRSDAADFTRLMLSCEAHPHPSRQACATCARRLERAVGLYRGELLEGFSLKGSSIFEDWVLVKREQFRRQALSALSDLAEHYLQEREYDQAERAARRQVELDPYREAGHRQVMRALAQGGQRRAALEHYEQLSGLLDADLGEKPEAETTRLYEKIFIEDYYSDNPAAELRGGGGRLSPQEVKRRRVFVGRRGELARLSAGFEEVQNGQGQLVFVSGEAGWGKTALIEEFLRRKQVTNPDAVLAFGHGNAYTGVGDPYWPFRELLEFLTGDMEGHWPGSAIGPEAADRMWQLSPLAIQAIVGAGPDLVDTFLSGGTLLGRARQRAAARGSRGRAVAKPAWLSGLEQLLERRAATQAGASPVQQGNLFEQYTRVLQILARSSPLILVLDDLQWFDASSVGLLFHLGKQIAGSRILVIGAYRPSELILDRSRGDADEGQPERHPLASVINELKREGGEIEIVLDREEKGFVDALLDAEPNRLEAAFREMLYQQTRGHPLFTVELLEGLKVRGGLVQDGEGRWVAGEALEWERLPARVEAAIAERLQRVPKRLLEVLRAASLEGEVFSSVVVAGVLEVEETVVVKWLSEELGREHRLVRAVGVRWLEGERLLQYQFDHILFQRYLYGSLDPIERAYLHGKVGQVLEGLAGKAAAGNAVVLSRHFQEAGDIRKAVHYLQLAGEGAMRVSAQREAIPYFEQALELLGRLGEGPEKLVLELGLQVDLALSIMTVRAYGDPRVKEEFGRARVLCEQLGGVPQLVPVLWQLGGYYVVCSDFSTGKTLLDQMEELSQKSGDPLLIALANWGLGWFEYFAGNYQDSIRRLDQMIAFYDPEKHRDLAFLYGQDPGAVSYAVKSIDLLAQGCPEQAKEYSRRSIELAQKISHPITLSIIYAYACVLYLFCEDFVTMGEIAESCIQVSKKYGYASWLASSMACQGWALARRGNTEEGLRIMRQAHVDLLKTGVSVHSGVPVLGIGETLGRMGQSQEGLQEVDELIRFLKSSGERAFTADVTRLRAELLLQLDPPDETRAEDAFLESIRMAREQGARFWELRATLGLARLWQRQGKVAQAHEALAGIYGQFTEGFDLVDLKVARELLEELK